ncbi:MAG TPA: PEGA domain-containing protein, partial [Kofleriaceae bacterium]|nr:PEGA domain-containing protein [Kofleriaceae bacterium]
RVEPRPDPRPDPTPDPTFDPAGPPGKLRITAEPYANVIIDGRQLGPTPILGRVLPAGRHEVILVDPVTGAIRLRRTVDVGAGQVVSVSVP